MRNTHTHPPLPAAAQGDRAVPTRRGSAFLSSSWSTAGLWLSSGAEGVKEVTPHTAIGNGSGKTQESPSGISTALLLPRDALHRVRKNRSRVPKDPPAAGGPAGWHPPRHPPASIPARGKAAAAPAKATCSGKKKLCLPRLIYFKAANQEAISSGGLIAGNPPCPEEESLSFPHTHTHTHPKSKERIPDVERERGIQGKSGIQAAKQIPNRRRGEEEVWES